MPVAMRRISDSRDTNPYLRVTKMSTDLTPRDASDKPNTDLANFVPLALNLADGRVEMTFDPQTPDGAKKLIQATLHECKKLEDMKDKTLEVTDYISHPASANEGEQGEVKEFTRIVVFDKSGEAYSCGSLGVSKSIALLKLTAGKGPWKPPIKCTVRIRRLANRNNWMILEPDLDSLSAMLTKKR